MLSDKKLSKIEKVLGKETLGELEAMPVDILKDHIIIAEHAINEAQRELEANPKYQDLKDSLKALSAGHGLVYRRRLRSADLETDHRASRIVRPLQPDSECGDRDHLKDGPFVGVFGLSKEAVEARREDDQPGAVAGL